MSFILKFPQEDQARAAVGQIGSPLVQRSIQLPSVQSSLIAPGQLRRRLSGLTLLAAGLALIGYLTYQRFFWQQALANPLVETGQVLAVDTRRASFGDLIRDSVAPFLSDPGLRVSEQTLASLPAAEPFEDITEFSLSLPRLGLKDRVVRVGVNGVDKSVYLPVLKSSLAHFGGTALPGQEGNSFIFGHSMLPILARNSYESVFTYLPKMAPGDLIWVEINGRRLKYQVFDTEVVEPTDVGILAQPRGEKWLTLMTCVPPGFGQKRLLVKAKMLSVL